MRASLRADLIAFGSGALMALCGGAVAASVPERVRAGVDAAVDDVADAIAGWVDATFDAARSDVERTHGVFVYTPGVGDALDGEWSGIDALGRDRSVVVLVHGLDEPGDVWAELSPALFDAGYAVVRFDYPNDQAIGESGAAMFEAMHRVRERGVERVDIVGHSMGGLVTQEMLTAEGMYAGSAWVSGAPRVGRVVAVGTPFHGSALAQFQAVGEVRDQVVRCFERAGGDPRALLGFLYDGRGEAGDDLMPGSEYLRGVSGRSISGEIAVTSVVGRALPVDGVSVGDALRDSWVSWALGDDGVGAIARAADRVADRIGDGAVTESSACGVMCGDEVVVCANHRSLLRRGGMSGAMASVLGVPSGEPPAIAVILDRLSGDGVASAR